MRLVTSSLLACALLFAIAPATRAAGTPANALVLVDAADIEGLRPAVELVRASGGRVFHVISPNAIIAELPPGADAALVAASLAPRGFPGAARPSRIVSVERGPADPERFRALGPTAEGAVIAWNANWMDMALAYGLEDPPGFARDATPLAGDCILPANLPDPFPGGAEAGDGMRAAKGWGAKLLDTSEFMLGDIVVHVITPESNGGIDPSTENWTAGMEATIQAEIVNGFDWWIARAAGEGISLTFFYEFTFRVPCPYEPINNSDDAAWIRAVVDTLGYGSIPNLDRAVKRLVSDTIEAFDVHWGAPIFLVNDLVDPDNMFPGGGFAYAYLGSRVVMTYQNDGWGTANMDGVAAHEVGHSFYALDEYASACGSCTATSGYLRGENQNCDGSPCASDIGSCIMRSVGLGSATACVHTRKQIGWQDANGNGIQDILDPEPVTDLAPYSPDPSPVNALTYSDSARVSKLENQNLYGEGNDITLKKIAGVEYRVDGGAWTAASPTDGSWDLHKEEFSFTTDPLLDGAHVIEVRAIDDYGVADSTGATDTVTVATATSAPAPAGVAAATDGIRVENQPNPFNPRTEISFAVSGDREAWIRLGVFDVSGRLVRALFRGWAAPGEHSLAWDGRDDSGRPASSGVYFSVLEIGGERAVRRMALVR